MIPLSGVHCTCITSKTCKTSKEIQKYKNTKIQKYKNIKIQKYKNTKIQKYKNTKIQKYKNTKIQKYKYVNPPSHHWSKTSKTTKTSNIVGQVRK
jgi:hypothetical protein